MSFIVRRTSNPAGPSPDINVTPLVDVMLVLLIIFMVLTPALSQEETLRLPESAHADPKKKELDVIEVSLAVDSTLRLEGTDIREEGLRAALRELHAAEPDRKLLLRADARLPYARVRALFASLQGLGFRGVSLKTVQREGG